MADTSDEGCVRRGPTPENEVGVILCLLGNRYIKYCLSRKRVWSQAEIGNKKGEENENISESMKHP